MTSAWGTCARCAATAQAAELRVYRGVPGTIVRCPVCGSVVIVLVRIRDALRIDDSRFKLAPGSTGDSG